VKNIGGKIFRAYGQGTRGRGRIEPRWSGNRRKREKKPKGGEKKEGGKIGKRGSGRNKGRGDRVVQRENRRELPKSRMVVKKKKEDQMGRGGKRPGKGIRG